MCRIAVTAIACGLAVPEALTLPSFRMKGARPDEGTVEGRGRSVEGESNTAEAEAEGAEAEAEAEAKRRTKDEGVLETCADSTFSTRQCSPKLVSLA